MKIEDPVAFVRDAERAICVANYAYHNPDAPIFPEIRFGKTEVLLSLDKFRGKKRPADSDDDERDAKRTRHI